MDMQSLRRDGFLAIRLLVMAIGMPALATDQTDNLPPAVSPAPTGTTTRKLPDRIYLPRELAHVLRLTKAAIHDEVIIAYVKALPVPPSLTTAQLITLKDLG